MEDANETLCVGIDLGTSRSSVSASNGERHVVDSYVGWPVDMVARKVVQKPVLVGRDALDNRSMLDLRRPLERGVIREGSERDEEAVLELLRHLMALVGLKQKGKSRPKVRAVVGVPAEAFRVSRQRLRGAMDGLADSVMLVSEPFAVAYGLEALLHAMIIDIGAGTTDLCIMQGRYPAEEDQRTLPDAGDAVDEQLSKVIRERHPEAQFSIHMIRTREAEQEAGLDHRLGQEGKVGGTRARDRGHGVHQLLGYPDDRAEMRERLLGERDVCIVGMRSCAEAGDSLVDDRWRVRHRTDDWHARREVTLDRGGRNCCRHRQDRLVDRDQVTDLAEQGLDVLWLDRDHDERCAGDGLGARQRRNDPVALFELGHTLGAAARCDDVGRFAPPGREQPGDEGFTDLPRPEDCNSPLAQCHCSSVEPRARQAPPLRRRGVCAAVRGGQRRDSPRG